nr:hypothetical protein [Bacteroidales bacterium]
FEALEIVRRSAFTPGELLSYNQYWLNISTEKSAMERERAEGRAEGIEQGRADAMREIARTMKQHGDDINYIAAVTGLSLDEIKTLSILS